MPSVSHSLMLAQSSSLLLLIHISSTVLSKRRQTPVPFLLKGDSHLSTTWRGAPPTTPRDAGSGSHRVCVCWSTKQTWISSLMPHHSHNVLLIFRFVDNTDALSSFLNAWSDSESMISHPRERACVWASELVCERACHHQRTWGFDTPPLMWGLKTDLEPH